jgi:hypothetical protein
MHLRVGSTDSKTVTGPSLVNKDRNQFDSGSDSFTENSYQKDGLNNGSESKSESESLSLNLNQIDSDISNECKKVIAENFNFTESDISQRLFFKLYRKCKTEFIVRMTESCYCILNPCLEFKKRIATEISCRRVYVDDKTHGTDEIWDFRWEMDDGDVVSTRILRAYEYVFKNSKNFLETPTFSEMFLQKKHSMYITTEFIDFFDQPVGKLKKILSHLVGEYNERKSMFESEVEHVYFKNLLGIFEKMLLSELSDILLHYDQMVILGKKELRCVFSTIMDIYENHGLTDTEKYFPMCRYVSSTD